MNILRVLAVTILFLPQVLYAARLSEAEVEHLADQFIRLYQSNAQISKEAVHQLSESIGNAYSFVVLKKPVWRGASQSLLICSTRILKTGACKAVKGRPSPWLGPQEYLEGVWPDKNPVIKHISYYPANATIYLFYSFVESKRRAASISQDPSLTAEDIPWNQISATKVDQVDRLTSVNQANKPVGVVKLPYKDFYVPGQDIDHYDSGFFTLRLRTFKRFSDVRSFSKTYNIPNVFRITTRENGERILHVYFGIFPTEDDVYRALETLPGAVIRRKPTLHSVAQVQLEDHIYTKWKQSQVDELRRAVAEKLGKEQL